jgi:hypothetical protein
MQEFEVVKVNPAPLERSRVLIRKTSEEGGKETIATFSILEGSRSLTIELGSEEIPLKIRREVFEKL